MADPDDIQAQAIAALLAETSITDIVGQRVYPGAIPEEVQHQFCIRVVKIADLPYQALSGASGSTIATIQVDSIGDNKETVNLLGKRVRLLITGSMGGQLGDANINGAWKTNEFDDDDPPIDGSDRWRYRRVTRFDIDYCEDVV